MCTATVAQYCITIYHEGINFCKNIRFSPFLPSLRGLSIGLTRDEKRKELNFRSVRPICVSSIHCPCILFIIEIRTFTRENSIETIICIGWSKYDRGGGGLLVYHTFETIVSFTARFASRGHDDLLELRYYSVHDY